MTGANGWNYVGGWKYGYYDGRGTLTTEDGVIRTKGEFSRGDPYNAVSYDRAGTKTFFYESGVGRAPDSIRCDVSALNVYTNRTGSPYLIGLNENEWEAVLSCHAPGQDDQVHAIESCLPRTDSLEVTSDGTTRRFQSYNAREAGQYARSGLHIHLSNSFELRVQNAQDYLVLEVTIYDYCRNIVFQKAASQGDIIRVSN